ncbi:MAG: XRE family transcriptional regulator [Acetobacteraceae bacterium]|nr:XRE family transcriptional regulator [Acetobacteraceae bacterium]
MLDIRPLRSEADYDAALVAVEDYFEHEPALGSPEADRFDLLALVIADYEAKHWAIDPPEAPDLLRAHMERTGLKQADLAVVLGSKARASEVLNRRRHLTPGQAWKIHVNWKLPAEALIRPYALLAAKRGA